MCVGGTCGSWCAFMNEQSIFLPGTTINRLKVMWPDSCLYDLHFTSINAWFALLYYNRLMYYSIFSSLSLTTMLCQLNQMWSCALCTTFEIKFGPSLSLPSTGLCTDCNLQVNGLWWLRVNKACFRFHNERNLGGR